MDPITLAGLALAVITMLAASFMAGMNPFAIFLGDPGSIVLVVGGTLGTTMASGTMKQALAAPKVMIKGLMGGGALDMTASIKQLVEFADIARREGLLALESAVEKIEDPFFRRGLELAVDGTDPGDLREMLELDLDKMGARHRDGAAFFTTAAGMGPAMGMVGTVIGLVDMLGKLDDPSSLGPSMAIAFLTTLWGAFIANYIFQPLASRLKKLSADEMAGKEMILEGILSIQAGSNPRAVAGKLVAFLPPGDREEVLGADKKSA
ncbi:MAG: motility protein A [Acidimicrobiales bacterium]